MLKILKNSFVIFLVLTSLSLKILHSEEIDAGRAVYVGKEMVKGYEPETSLQSDVHEISKPKFPVIDVHTHFSLETDRELLIKNMDELGVKRIVNLSGGYGDKLEKMIEKFYKFDSDRFVIFCNIDFSLIDNEDFGLTTAAYLEKAHADGAKGVKIFKTLGLTIKDKSGTIVPVDDARIDIIWEKAGELGMPVLIHTADPVAFFKPIDGSNERWLQLQRHPDWSFYGNEFPDRDDCLAQRDRVISRHPETTFIGAHVGNCAEDLKRVSETLEKFPNFFVDFAGRVAELGRQPYSARKFFIKYQNRILFGTDRYPGRPKQPRYRIYYRFLETDDEYFDYYKHPFPPTGEWKIYGLFLPRKVLKKIYYLNAERIIGD